MAVVSFDTALTSPGLRLVLLSGVPSPWSQAALAIFHYKKLPFVHTNSRPADPAFQRWNGARNLPALLSDDEPVRTGWAEILALAERLAPEPRLIPSDAEARIRTIGLCHELMGEGGLTWNARLLAIDAGLSTEGREGFPLRAAQYLAPRYGWHTACASRARERAMSALALLDAELTRNRGDYYAGNELSALDFYSAATLNILVPLPDSEGPIPPPLRAAFTWMGQTLASAISPALLEHRDRVVSRFFAPPLDLE
ncbi:MAG: glutathione S-transferase N-terminal domain-containing protein [Polyangiaceae bacterium]